MAEEQTNVGPSFQFEQDGHGQTPSVFDHYTDEELLKYFWENYLKSTQFQNQSSHDIRSDSPDSTSNPWLTSVYGSAQQNTQLPQFGTEMHHFSHNFPTDSCKPPEVKTESYDSRYNSSSKRNTHELWSDFPDSSKSSREHSASFYSQNSYVDDDLEDLTSRSSPKRTSLKHRHTNAYHNIPPPNSSEQLPHEDCYSRHQKKLSENQRLNKTKDIKYNVDEICNDVFKDYENGIDQSFVDHLDHQQATDKGWEKYYDLFKDSMDVKENGRPESRSIDSLDEFQNDESELQRHFHDVKWEGSSYRWKGRPDSAYSDSRNHKESLHSEASSDNSRYNGTAPSCEEINIERKSKVGDSDDHRTVDDFARNLRKHFQKSEKVPVQEQRHSYANAAKAFNTVTNPGKASSGVNQKEDIQRKEREPKTTRKCTSASSSEKSDFSVNFAKNLQRHFASKERKSKASTWESVDGKKKKSFFSKDQEFSSMGLSEFTIPEQTVSGENIPEEILECGKEETEEHSFVEEKQEKNTSFEKAEKICQKQENDSDLDVHQKCPENKVLKGREKLPKESGLKGPYRRRKVTKKSKGSKSNTTENADDEYRRKLSSEEMENLDSAEFLWELFKWAVYKGKAFSIIFLSRSLILLLYLLMIQFLVVSVVIQRIWHWVKELLYLLWKKIGVVLLVKFICYALYIWILIRSFNPGGIKEKMKRWVQTIKGCLASLIGRRRRNNANSNQERTSRSSKPPTSSYVPTSGEDEVDRLLEYVAESEEKPYRVLGVSEDCNNEEIKKQYKRLAVLVHPDKNPHPRAGEAFQVLSNANYIIGDPEKRRQFDVNRYMAKRQMNEFQEFMTDLEKMMQEMKQYMACDSCGSKHKKYLTNKTWDKARYCGECLGYHYVMDGDVWAESQFLGMKMFVYACMDGEIYDISEWAQCQGLHPTPNTHHKYGTMKFRRHGGSSAQTPPPPRSNPFHDDWSDVFSQPFPGSHYNDVNERMFPNPKKKKRGKRKKK